MPRICATDRRAGYDLICFDSSGEERRDDPDGLMSDLILRTLAPDDSGITDVFFLSHGWNRDIPAAKLPHVVGINWPSLPWGDESMGDATAFDAPGTTGSTDPVSELVDASRIADTPAAREAIRKPTHGTSVSTSWASVSAAS